MRLFKVLRSFLTECFNEEELDYREIELSLAKLPGVVDRTGTNYSYSMGTLGSVGLRKLTRQIFPEQVAYAAEGDLDGYGEYVRLLVLTLPGMDWSNAVAAGDLDTVAVYTTKIENWWWHNVRLFKLTPEYLKSKARLYSQRGMPGIKDDYNHLMNNADQTTPQAEAQVVEVTGNEVDKDLPGDEVPSDWDPSLQG